jgi:uncharacterized membrane protein
LDGSLATFDLYRILLFLHIGGAIVWVGGAITLQILAILIIRSDDLNRLAQFAGDTESIGLRVFMSASLVVLVCGIGLVIKGAWGFGHFWVVLGLAAFVFCFLSGLLYISPHSGKAKELIEANKGVATEAVAERIKNILTASRIELGILVLIVFLMVFKPGS